MKKIYTFILLGLIISKTHSQNVFWTENFGFGCTQGFKVANAIATPTNGMWSMTSFNLPYLNGPDANEWFVSAEEQGQAIGVCGGQTCGGLNDRSLHVGANVLIPPPAIIDIGADYESGAISNTNKRANTPLINTTGHYNIQLSFKYMAEGIPGNDYCEIEYSGDGGTTWFTLTIIPPSTNSVQCPTNGYWKFFAVGLPPLLNNNPTVKIGFHWYNNDPNGAHPSIAIDDMQLSELTMTTSSTVSCLSATSTASLSNIAVGNTSFTWAAQPNTVTFTPNSGTTTSIQFPSNGTYTLLAYGSNSVAGAATSTAVSVVTVGFGSQAMVNATTNKTLICTGQSATLTAVNATSYTWTPGGANTTIVVSPTISTTYTVTGKIGYCVSTYTIMQQVSTCAGIVEMKEDHISSVFPNPFTNELYFSTQLEMEVQMMNMMGDIVKEARFTNDSSINTLDLPKGIYFLIVRTGTESKRLKVIKE